MKWSTAVGVEFFFKPDIQTCKRVFWNEKITRYFSFSFVFVLVLLISLIFVIYVDNFLLTPEQFKEEKAPKNFQSSSFLQFTHMKRTIDVTNPSLAEPDDWLFG